MFPNVPISWAGASGVNVGTYSIHGVSVFFMSREHTWRRFTKPSMVLDRRIYIYIYQARRIWQSMCSWPTRDGDLQASSASLLMQKKWVLAD